MKQLLSIILLSALVFSVNLTFAQTSKLPKPPKGKKWVKIETISDEFNGDQLDSKKWIPYHPYWTGRNSTHTPSNVSVKDGNLRLKSTLRKGATEVNAETVTAACVTSKKRSCRYGYYEAKIKCSNISMTSAFWFQGKYSEIDVIENLGAPSKPERTGVKDTMMINTHYFKKGWDNDLNTPLKYKMPVPAGSTYHVYAVWWKDANTCIFYLNGEQVYEVALRGPFKEKQYLFFDTEVFTWQGWPTKESLLDDSKNTMLVDWVRGWQLVDL
ncbi:family 16 glycosylhydrolase [Seonamhaeicola sp.]|uniref:family 16 glycosylhydrolase n=1 Tax=Seonamhaeicola sp. TaxID=1912245 RepID=UPI0026344AFD|nr:family 16 glycosylhydrolase [Seonamhaeicola sp.]